MSARFPTHLQFVQTIRGRLSREYPGADRASLEDCVKIQTKETIWLQHLAKLIEDGVQPELRVLDTLSSEQLYNLRKHYAPRGSLDWYIPARFRTYRGLDPLA